MTKIQQSLAVFRHRNFRLFLGIRFLLTFAAQIQTTIIGFYVYQLTHSKIAIAFIGLSEVIPAMAIALYGGHGPAGWLYHTRRRAIHVHQNAITSSG